MGNGLVVIPVVHCRVDEGLRAKAAILGIS